MAYWVNCFEVEQEWDFKSLLTKSEFTNNLFRWSVRNQKSSQLTSTRNLLCIQSVTMIIWSKHRDKLVPSLNCNNLIFIYFRFLFWVGRGRVVKMDTMLLTMKAECKNNDSKILLSALLSNIYRHAGIFKNNERYIEKHITAKCTWETGLLNFVL